MTNLRLTGGALSGSRAFLYVKASEDVVIAQRQQTLVDFAAALGVRVLTVFVDLQRSESESTAVFGELLDALWRNDGVLLLLGEPAQLAKEPAAQRACRARINATAAQVLYAHG
ncbi:hypothetical protein ACFCV3_37975 [Kribbella sp. NPDC056345]|uniref:hypothetical protein n=1 Tax=Kribbella sp. NPDC056345 TaxID=3345789 RepID=UPI0035DBEB54